MLKHLTSAHSYSEVHVCFLGAEVHQDVMNITTSLRVNITSLNVNLLLTDGMVTWPVQVRGGSVVREQCRSRGVSGRLWVEGGPCRALQTEACWETWVPRCWSLLGMDVLPLAERDP